MNMKNTTELSGSRTTREIMARFKHGTPNLLPGLRRGHAAPDTAAMGRTMQLQKKLRCCRGLLLALLCAMPGTVLADAGRIQFVSGEAKVIAANGAERIARKGAAIEEGDTIVTAKGSSMQIVMGDGGLLAVRPDTRLRIDAFQYQGKNDGSDKSFISLAKGTFRSITGAIGKANKENYKISTPGATIGIRGTDHEPMYIPPAMAGETSLGPAGTYDKVNAGETYLQTPEGIRSIGINQIGYVADAHSAPTLLPVIPQFYRSASPPPPKPGTESAQRRADGKAPINNAEGKTAAKNQDNKATMGKKGDMPLNESAPAQAPKPPASPEARAPGTPTPGVTVPGAPSPGIAPIPGGSLPPLDGMGALLPLLAPTNPQMTGGTMPPAGSTSNLLGGTQAPIGFGSVGADTWQMNTGPASGSGGMDINGDPGKTMLLGPNKELMFTSDNTGGGKFQFSAGTATLLNTGSAIIPTPSGGVPVNWGRWAGGFTVIDQGAAKNSLGSFHFMDAGKILPSSMLPLTGSWTYSYIGGTAPTDHNGAAGNIIATNTSLNVNFTAGTMTYNVNAAIAGNTWLAGGTGPINGFYGSGPGLMLGGSCTGACGSVAMGTAHGMFVGGQAEGAISSFNLSAPGATATGTAVFKR